MNNDDEHIQSAVAVYPVHAASTSPPRQKEAILPEI
ncbi:hypothetical protein ABID20_003738 [Rhizobium alvei]